MRRRSGVSLQPARAVILLAAVVSAAGMAFAQTTTDWTLGAGGLYTSAGSTGSVLMGSNIPTLSVLGDGTSSHNGVTLSIIDGYLDFTSGVYNGNGSNWSWGPGGTLTLMGCIAGVTATTCTGSNNVDLLSDDFQSVQIVPIFGGLDVVFGNITGTLNDAVATYFGVSKQFETASFTTAIDTSGKPGSSLVGSNLLGLIKADPPATGMPEQWGLVDALSFCLLSVLVVALLLRYRILRLAIAK